MDPGEQLTARLVRPPPVAATRLLRPPSRKAGALIGAALASARRLPLPWALLAAARLLRAAGWSAPMIVAAGAFRHALASSGDPLRAFIEVAGAPAVWLAGFGVTCAALVASAAIEILGWTVGLPALRDRLQDKWLPPALRSSVGPAPAAPLARRFAVLVQTAALLLLAALVWVAAIVPLVAIAFSTWLDAHEAQAGGALLASVGLALVLALALLGTLLLRLLAEAAVVRAGAFGNLPLVAIWEGGALILRRPLVFLGALYLLSIAGILTAAALGFPAALAPPNAPGFAVHVIAELATAAAAGLLALARLGVFLGASLETSAD